MKEYDKRKSHISSKLHTMYKSSNKVRHPITKTFTPLHYTSPIYEVWNFNSGNYLFTTDTK